MRFLKNLVSVIVITSCTVVMTGCGPSYSEAVTTLNTENQILADLQKSRDERVRVFEADLSAMKSEEDKLEGHVRRYRELFSETTASISQLSPNVAAEFDAEQMQNYRELESQLSKLRDANLKVETKWRDELNFDLAELDREIERQQTIVKEAQKLRDSLRQD